MVESLLGQGGSPSQVSVGDPTIEGFAVIGLSICQRRVTKLNANFPYVGGSTDECTSSFAQPVDVRPLWAAADSGAIGSDAEPFHGWHAHGAARGEPIRCELAGESTSALLT